MNKVLSFTLLACVIHWAPAVIQAKQCHKPRTDRLGRLSINDSTEHAWTRWRCEDGVLENIQIQNKRGAGKKSLLPLAGSAEEIIPQWYDVLGVNDYVMDCQLALDRSTAKPSIASLLARPFGITPEAYLDALSIDDPTLLSPRRFHYYRLQCNGLPLIAGGVQIEELEGIGVSRITSGLPTRRPLRNSWNLSLQNARQIRAVEENKAYRAILAGDEGWHYVWGGHDQSDSVLIDAETGEVLRQQPLTDHWENALGSAVCPGVDSEALSTCNTNPIGHNNKFPYLISPQTAGDDIALSGAYIRRLSLL